MCSQTKPSAFLFHLKSPTLFTLIPSDILPTHTTMALINITGDDFEKEVLSAKEPVLVFFWAAWSGPSKMVRPLLEE